MEAYARAPQCLPEHGNRAENWIKWRREFELFMDLTKEKYINQEPLKGKLLLNLIGRVGLDALEKIDFDEPEDKENMHILIKKFEEYFNPPKNEIIARYNFFKREQGNNETLQNYVKDLKRKAKKCNFGELEESLVRDKVILSVKDETLLKTIFDTTELDLQKLVSIIVQHGSSKKPEKKGTNIEKNVKVQNELNNPENLNLNKKQKVCWRCNNEHKMGKCTAYDIVCNGCGLKGHIQNANSCRIAFLKKKQIEVIKEKPQNIQSKEKQFNVNINRPEIKKENYTYQQNPFCAPPPLLPQYNTRPSAPELSALYPDLTNMQAKNNLPSAMVNGPVPDQPKLSMEPTRVNTDRKKPKKNKANEDCVIL